MPWDQLWIISCRTVSELVVYLGVSRWNRSRFQAWCGACGVVVRGVVGVSVGDVGCAEDRQGRELVSLCQRV